MADETTEAGLIQVLAERFEKQRLPVVLDLEEKVGRGETLNEFDIRFLEDVFRDAQQMSGLIERHPEWHEVAAKMMRLYREITGKALENEQASNPGS